MSDYDEDEDAFDDEKINEDIASPDKRVRADAIERLAIKTYQQGNSKKTLVLLDTVLDLRQEIKDYSGLIATFTQRGFVNSELGHFKEALESYLGAVESAQLAHNTIAEIDSLHHCGTMMRKLKDAGKAAQYYGEALELANEIDYKYKRHIQADYARMLRKIGDLEKAERLLAEAQEEMMNNGFESNVPRVENELATTLMDEKHTLEALEKATEAYHLADYEQNQRETDRARYLMARCLNQLGRFAEAYKILEEMKERRQQGKRQKHRARTDLEMARAMIGLQRRWDAAKLLETLVPVLKAHKLDYPIAEALAMRGENLLAMGDALEAEQVLAEAISVADDNAFDGVWISATYDLARCYEVLGRVSDMIHQFELITSNPLNMSRGEFWAASAEIALHYAKAGNTEATNRYLKLLIEGPTKFVTSALIGRAEESQYWLLLGQGQKVKAKNMANKAMVSYLLEGCTDDATRLAEFIRDLG